MHIEDLRIEDVYSVEENHKKQRQRNKQKTRSIPTVTKHPRSQQQNV